MSVLQYQKHCFPNFPLEDMTYLCHLSQEENEAIQELR